MSRFAPAVGWRVPPRRTATLILVVVLGAYAALAVVGVVFATSTLGQALAGCAVVLALVGLQLGYLSRPDRRPQRPWSYVALAVQAVLTLVPIVLFGPMWHGFPGLLAGSALLVLPPVLGVPAFVLTLAAIAVAGTVRGPAAEVGGLLPDQVYGILSATTCGLAVYGLTTLVRLVQEAHDAREELRRAAVAQERLRLARDIHHVLGQTLSVIALRGELIARLVHRDAARTGRELADVLLLTRRALTEVRRVVGFRRDDGPPDGPGHGAVQRVNPTDWVAPRLGSVMLAGVLASTSVVLVVGMAQERGAVAALVFAATRVALIVLLLAVTRAGADPDRRTRLVVLAVMTVLGFAPQPFLGPYSHGSEVLVGGAALLLLQPFAAVVAASLTAASAVLIELLDPTPNASLGYSLAYTGFGAVLLTLIIYGLGTMPRLVAQLREARDELAAAAAVAERIRVGRDVHDLLGLGLSTITMKCELAGKLLDRSPERAATEVAEVLVASRRALADVRSVISGGADLSLEEEWSSVAATLEAADVAVRATQVDDCPGGAEGTVLATVLREGATNVLRHSSARWCEITIRQVPSAIVLEIVNDGVRVPDGAAPAEPDGGVGGNGLRNMADRLRGLGGDLETDLDGQCHRLRAEVPLRRR